MQELFNDDDTGDILIQTDTATFSAHSPLLLHHVQLLTSLACHLCRPGHHKTVIILPGVESQSVENALRDLYLKGDSRKLNWIFTANNVVKTRKDKLISRNINIANDEKDTFNDTNINHNQQSSDPQPSSSYDYEVKVEDTHEHEEENLIIVKSSHPRDDTGRVTGQLVVKNTTRYPVPEYIKEALVENNPDRGIRFTLSNLLNDQMLLGK